MGTAESGARQQVAAVQERLLADAALDVTARFVTLDGGPRLQVLEAGEGEPLVVLHGSGNSAVTMLPLMEQIRGRRVIVVDRPGYGLSEPTNGLREQPRRTGVDVVAGLLDVLEIDRADLVGNSTGGFWSLWTALDRPERVRRIVLVGATPLLPGTRPPVPLRLMTTPVVGALLQRTLPEPSPRTVTQMMRSMGEGDTIGRHPGVIDALVAAGRDPIAGQATGEELAGVIRGIRGFRPAFQFSHAELGKITQPTLLIWGDHDPVGSLDAARAATDLIPHAQLAEVPTGHGPWFGEPALTADLITRFLNAPDGAVLRSRQFGVHGDAERTAGWRRGLRRPRA